MTIIINAVITPAAGVSAGVVTPAPVSMSLFVGEGPSGPQGTFVGQLSAAPNQLAVVDGDGKLLVPDPVSDPLAYYILAKA